MKNEIISRIQKSTLHKGEEKKECQTIYALKYTVCAKEV